MGGLYLFLFIPQIIKILIVSLIPRMLLVKVHVLNYHFKNIIAVIFLALFLTAEYLVKPYEGGSFFHGLIYSVFFVLLLFEAVNHAHRKSFGK